MPATAEGFGLGVGDAVFGLGETFGEGVVNGVGLGFVLDAVDEFVFAGFAFVFELADEAFAAELSRGEAFLLFGDEGMPRLFAFALRPGSLVLGLDRSRGRFAATVDEPARTFTTTSSLFPRCSTCAVAPGCSRNESTVLSPTRWDFTSANPLPRTASALGTSAAGIFT